MRHYCYRHIRNDKNEPFYIGIGTAPVHQISTEAFTYPRSTDVLRRSMFWHSVYNSSGHDISIDIIYESDDYNEILEKEKEFIKLYGRKNKGTGSLVNLTDGGDGALGHVKSEESKRKMSEKMKGIPPPRTAIINRINNNKNRPMTNAQRSVIDLMSIINTGKQRSPETKSKISVAHTGRRIPVEQIERWREKMRNRIITQEERISTSAAISAALLGKFRKTIIQYNKSGEELCRYSGIQAAADAVHGSIGSISSCVSGSRKTHKGYQWGYEPFQLNGA